MTKVSSALAALTLALALLLAVPALPQPGSVAGITTGSVALAQGDEANQGDDDNTGRWGLAGLLGLAGLAGLRRRDTDRRDIDRR